MTSSLRVIALLLCSLVFGTLASAQKPGSKYYEDTTQGFKFKPLKDWAANPIREDLKQRNIVGKFATEKAISVKLPNNSIAQSNVDLYVFRFNQPAAVTGGEGGLRARSGEVTKRPTIEEIIPQNFPGFRDFKEGLAEPFLEPEEEKLKKGLKARHATYVAASENGFDIYLDTWTVSLDDFDLAFLYILPDQRRNNKKWLKAFETSLKSLQLIERDLTAPTRVSEEASYEDQLAFHKSEAEKTPGWRAVETPSEQYIIKTSTEDDDFIEEVIDRLEASRRVFEKDFPPKQEIKHISVVRVCKDRTEFQQYSGAGDGVAGYFSPRTTELVLFDSSDRDRRETLAVMSHEAFHQYCYFLFDRSEAHRWFDEGLGDYYGGFEFKGKKAIPTAHMPGGLDRFQGIKTLVREGRFKPIFNHINYNHPQWQSQGPRNTSPYEQSWSIIYFLRMGEAGDVPKKIWEDEYGDIIPKYIEALHAGYSTAYEEVRARAEAELAELPRSDATAEQRVSLENFIKRPRIREARKKEIWKAAMDASWGPVDIAEFEENWKEFVMEYMD